MIACIVQRLLELNECWDKHAEAYYSATVIFCAVDNHAVMEATVNVNVIDVFCRIVTNGVACIH